MREVAVDHDNFLIGKDGMLLISDAEVDLAQDLLRAAELLMKLSF